MLSERAERVLAVHQDRLAGMYRGDNPGHVFSIAGLPLGYDTGPAALEAPRQWVSRCVDDLGRPMALVEDAVTFRPPVLEPGTHGVHFVDALFGAEVFAGAGQVWSRELVGDLVDLSCPDPSESPLAVKAIECARTSLEATAGRVWLGTVVLASPLNVGVNLWGERLLAALINEPESAVTGLRTVTDTIAGLHRAYRQAVPPDTLRFYAASSRFAPAGFGHICGCTTQLVSRAVYEEHVAPLDREILGLYPEGGSIHLCGAHEHLIPVFRDMEELRAVQLNDRASDGFPHYYAGLRDDQLIYVTPSEQMPLDRILAISGGHRVIIQSCIGERIGLRKPLEAE